MSFLVPSPADRLSPDIADYPEGIVLPVDKPYRWTSADVIRKLKYAAVRHFGKKKLKVGHAGTLDPLATGVLLVCIGAACRQAQRLQDHDKEYIARIRFGATTPSYDLEKEADRFFPYAQIDEAAVRAALPAFVGEQEQVAPLFSAKSIDGVRAYELARKLYRSGQGGRLDSAALESLQRNRIRIDAAELCSFTPAGQAPASPEAAASAEKASARIHVADTASLGLPEAEVRIVCSKGTYIRAFARDLGEALDSGAHLAGLIRSRSGDFRREDALSVEEALALLSR